MEPVTLRTYTESERMEVRSFVHLAGEAIAPFWPMRIFIHHNPLHGLEDLDFDAAVACGRSLLGGEGYFPNTVYREYLNRGRLRPEHVREALQARSPHAAATLGSRTLHHLDVLYAHMIEGLTPPSGTCLSRLIQTSDDGLLVERLAHHLESGREVPDHEGVIEETTQADRDRLGGQLTLATWCDRTFGTEIEQLLDQEMIKWCAAYLDEGHAAWALPDREQSLYGAWRLLAREEWGRPLLGIPNWDVKMARIPFRPEDALLESLHRMGIPKHFWSEYLARHLASLPGWAGFIKWRAERSDYPWQSTYPADLVQFLAIRLFYERELVEHTCRRLAGLLGTYETLVQFMVNHAPLYWLLRERAAGRLSEEVARQIPLGSINSQTYDGRLWQPLAIQAAEEQLGQGRHETSRAAAWQLVALARVLDCPPETLLHASSKDLQQVIGWLEEFPESQHGPCWLQALELAYQEHLLQRLEPNVQNLREPPPEAGSNRVRHAAQAVFCIDVRSESFRRHLESLGGYETYGFAGFFGVPIQFRPFGNDDELSLCPVLVRPKHIVREVPRSYQGETAEKALAGMHLAEVGHTLLHDLKQNVITPYVMVEAVGWFFSLPFIGKTLFKRGYRRATQWLQYRMEPPVATTLTVDKLSRADAEQYVMTEQRAIVRRALRERLDQSGSHLTQDLIEDLRRDAMEEAPLDSPGLERIARVLGIPSGQVRDFIGTLRQTYQIEHHWAARRLDRLTRTGFTLSEQAHFVETALRLIGLTENFARLVLFCGHASTSDNNPYESALDCGACGGNPGLFNARVLAAMANRPHVRKTLAERGLVIPSDTHFLAGQHDTTTDRVRLADLEDVPPTHRDALIRLVEDLEEAGARNSQERASRLPGEPGQTSPHDAMRRMEARSSDWGQVRPEWGLAGNAAIVIGRRELIQNVDLEGRTFLHSYDYNQDPTGRLLETIMTAPLIVAQWINMEHYFSTVDNEVYGSGSKVYHNVVGRFGVMYGTHSDLRIGLPRQTVMEGDRPYHEPLRLTAVIEAPQPRISAIIARNALLQQLFDRRWMHLIALNPADWRWARYETRGQWRPVEPA